MMDNPLLSIIIPVYNVEKYISECLDGILKIPASISTECILVDDCGCDESMKIAAGIISAYSGPVEFKILHHECNKGLSAARNTGLRLSKGEYVLFYDSDDTIASPGLCRLLQTACETNADIIVGDYMEHLEGTDAKSGEIKSVDAKKGVIFTGEKFFEANHIPLASVVWRNLFRRKFLIDSNTMFHEGVYFEDLEFTPVVFYRANSVVYPGELFYYYRKRDNSITTSNVSLKKVTDLILIWAELDNAAKAIDNRTLKSIFTEIGSFSFLRQYSLYGKPLDKKYISVIRSFNTSLIRNSKYRWLCFLLPYLPQHITLYLLRKYSQI